MCSKKEMEAALWMTNCTSLTMRASSSADSPSPALCRSADMLPISTDAAQEICTGEGHRLVFSGINTQICREKPWAVCSGWQSARHCSGWQCIKLFLGDVKGLHVGASSVTRGDGNNAGTWTHHLWVRGMWAFTSWDNHHLVLN